MDRYMQEYRDAFEADTYRLRDALRVEEEDEPTAPADRLDALEARVAELDRRNGKLWERIRALKRANEDLKDRVDALERRLEGVIENHSLWDGS